MTFTNFTFSDELIPFNVDKNLSVYGKFMGKISGQKLKVFLMQWKLNLRLIKTNLVVG